MAAISPPDGGWTQPGAATWKAQVGASWDPSPPAFGPATTTHGHTPASAPSIPFPPSPQASPYASTPPGGFGAGGGGIPRALHFSTPRSRRHTASSGGGLDADVDALCAELDARVKSLQLARARDSSGASPGAPAAATGPGGEAGGQARNPFSPEATYRYTSGTPQAAPSTLGGASGNDWAGARRQPGQAPMQSQVTPGQSQVMPGQGATPPLGDWNRRAHSPVWTGPYPVAYPDTQLTGTPFPQSRFISPMPAGTPSPSRFTSQSQTLFSPGPIPSPWASFPPPGSDHLGGPSTYGTLGTPTAYGTLGTPTTYGTLGSPSLGGLGPAHSLSASRLDVSGNLPLGSIGGAPGVYPQGQPFSPYSLRTPLGYNPLFAPSSVPPAVYGSQYYGASPSQLAGTPLPVHMAGLDWPPGSPGSYLLPTRHPASAPPHLGAPPGYLTTAGNDPGLTPPSLAGPGTREPFAHSGLPVAGTPGLGVPGVGALGGDLWGLRLLPSPSQVHTRAKKSAARGGAGSGGRVALAPMSPEEVRRAMGRLGVLLFLDSWRDAVRQWFATDLLATLVDKIRRAPGEVQESAAALGLSFEVDPFPEYYSEGSDPDGSADPFGLSAKGVPSGNQGGAGQGAGVSAGGVSGGVNGGAVAGEERSVGVQGRRVPEDEALQQLMWALQHLAQIHQQQQQAQSQKPQGMVFHLQTQQQQQQQQLAQDLERAASAAAIQRAVSAVLELQQLKEVLTGRWGDALLPRGMPLAYSLRRVQELAEGCCVRAYRWDGGGEYDGTGATSATAVALLESLGRPSGTTSAAAAGTAREVPGAAAPAAPGQVPAGAEVAPAGAGDVALAAPVGSYSLWVHSAGGGGTEPARATRGAAGGVPLGGLGSGSGGGGWPADLPTDSHLLAYLFCVYLAHPGWCFTKSLHQITQPPSPSPASPALSSPAPLPLGPLFVGSVLPASLAASMGPSRKLLAVVESLSGLSSTDVDVLIISQTCPAVFGVVWDRTLQFCSQGRTALWDTIIVLMQRMKQHHLSLFGIHSEVLTGLGLQGSADTCALQNLRDRLDAAVKR